MTTGTVKDMPLEAWDPKLLRRFREEWKLSKAELLRRLNSYTGLELVNWSTLHKWEAGRVPLPPYQVTLRRALDAIRRALEGEGKKRKARIRRA